MAADNPHELAVEAWFDRAAHDRAPVELLRAFEEAFAALWQRAHVTLGEVTLMAIAERVLDSATEQYPWLVSLEISGSGLRCQSLRAHMGLAREQLAAALRFVLREFLTVLGNLTAQILTPALHDELSRCIPGHNVARTAEDATS